MIKTQTLRAECFLAILAAVLIPQKNITATELYGIARNTIVCQQSDDTGHLKRVIDG